MSDLPIETDVEQVQQLLADEADFLLLDCREPAEYETAHIEGATLVPMSQIQARLKELESHKERHVVVHCHHGGRSLQVAQWLRLQGFEQSQSMAGGIDIWAVKIDPSVPRY